MNVPQQKQLFETLRAGRMVVEGHVKRMEELGSRWKEETVTDILLLQCEPCVKFATFSRHEESVIGSDWAWWWLDRTGECFGMLVQAKRYTRGKRSWSLTLRGGPDGQQLSRLLESAKLLKLSPQYILFRGEHDEPEEFCRRNHRDRDPLHCADGSVSILPATEAMGYRALQPRQVARLAMETACPLEHVAESAYSDRFRTATIDNILLGDHETKARSMGAHAIADELFRLAWNRSQPPQFEEISERRMGYSTSPPVVEYRPFDRWKSRESYRDSIYRGMRTAPPGYVTDLVDGKTPDNVPSQLVGAAVFLL